MYSIGPCVAVCRENSNGSCKIEDYHKFCISSLVYLLYKSVMNALCREKYFYECFDEF